MTQNNDGLRKLLHDAIEVGGVLANITLPLWLTDPSGLAIPVGVQALKTIGQDISNRMLSKRENYRIGSVLVLAGNGISERINNGEMLRTDGFFNEDDTGKSDAKEIVEAVLLKAKQDPEERKIPYMAHLLENMAFDTGISADTGHCLIKVAEDLTYRQLCIMKIAVEKDRFGLRDKSVLEMPEGMLTEHFQVLCECYDLYLKGYLHCVTSDKVSNILHHAGWMALRPSSIGLNGICMRIYDLMKLSLIPDVDVLSTVEALK